MSKRKEQITEKLRRIGACWAIRNDKFCAPEDSDGRRTYHVHPICKDPQQRYIKRFDTLAEIENWIDDGEDICE